MCGIAGFISPRGKSLKETLISMTSALSHRGPDGEGFYYQEIGDTVIGLGHRRLSIIDLSNAANQPMHYDGLHIIFNGEIYNYNEIRDELISLGHHFLTHSDTEVILHGWREWGEKSIEKWKGMFAIALFDENKNNTDALASFLQYNYVPSPYSIFKDCYKIPAGHWLKFNLETKKISLQSYWNVYDCYNKPKLDIDLREAIEETEKILQKAFQYRMVADVPVGVFLSGGFDSSCVTALLQKNNTEKIKTFTIGSTDKKLDEAPYAKKIAEHLGT